MRRKKLQKKSFVEVDASSVSTKKSMPKRSVFHALWLFLKTHFALLVVLFVFVFLFAFDNLPFGFAKTIMSDIKSIATNFTPTTDLFDDGSEVSFVSYFFGMNVNKRENFSRITFEMPSKMQNISTNSDELCFENAGLVFAMANGIVGNIGVDESGQKYVEIEHSSGYVSVYKNVKNVGVFSGEIVGAGDAIAVCDQNSVLKVEVRLNGQKQFLSDLTWKNS